MKKFRLLCIAGFAAIGLSTTASAQFYVGAGVGASKASGADGSTTIGGVAVSASGGNATKTSWKLYGGYQFTPNWGLEAQYSELGDRTYTVSAGAASGSTKLRAYQWSLAGTGTLPLSDQFYLMAKLGATRNHVGGGNFTVGAVSVAVGGSDRTELLAGIGAGYNINKNVGVRVEYENFGKLSNNGGINNSSVKGDNWSVSLKYSF